MTKEMQNKILKIIFIITICFCSLGVLSLFLNAYEPNMIGESFSKSYSGYGLTSNDCNVKVLDAIIGKSIEIDESGFPLNIEILNFSIKALFTYLLMVILLILSIVGLVLKKGKINIAILIISIPGLLFSTNFFNCLDISSTVKNYTSSEGYNLQNIWDTYLSEGTGLSLLIIGYAFIFLASLVGMIISLIPIIKNNPSLNTNQPDEIKKTDKNELN